MATEIQGAKIVTEEIENAAGANPYSITLGTVSTATGDATIDFTSIPSGVKHITVLGNQISTSGTSPVLFQLGDAGGFETAGYLGGEFNLATQNLTSTAGFNVHSATAAAGLYNFVVNLFLVNSASNIWAMHGHMSRTDSVQIHSGNGSKTLSAELTQVRVTTNGGSETFDVNGGINIQFQ